MSAAGLRCRVCEKVSRPEPVDACRRCDGPTDLTYDWERDRAPRFAATRSRPAPSRSGATRPPSGGRTRRARRRLDAPAPCRPPVRAARHRSASEARGSQPDPFVQGPHRHGCRGSAALDHGVTTLCCSSTGNLGDAVAAAAAATGLEAIVLAPVGGESAAVAARHPGARVFAVDGTYDDCRRLELELGALFPVGLRQREPASVRVRGREDDLLRDRRAARLAAAGRGRVPRGQRHALLEARPGLRRARPARELAAGPAAPDVRRPGTRGPARSPTRSPDDRGISRVEADTEFASLAVGDPSYGDLAIGAARATGGGIVAVAGRRDPREHGPARGDERGRRRTAPAAPRSVRYVRRVAARRGRARRARRPRRHRCAARAGRGRRRSGDDD